MAKRDVGLPPDDLYTEGRNTSCICHWLHPPAPGLSSWNMFLSRTSRSPSSEPTDLLEPQSPGICTKPTLFMPLPVDFALPEGSAPPPAPSGNPVANGTRTHERPWTCCPSPGFLLQSGGTSPSLLPTELSLVSVFPVPSGVIRK